MKKIRRLSPVHFEAVASETTERDFWTVTLSYADEGDGPYLVDLSHKARWDVQDSALDALRPWQMDLPPAPGQCHLQNGVLINRMNRSQISMWHLNAQAPEAPREMAYTDVTEATVFLALFGPQTFAITEKLTALDLSGSPQTPPYLVMGPFSHVPCQIVVMGKNDDHGSGVLFTCSRGYAHSMVHAVLDAGAEFGLRPAGEERFSQWLDHRAMLICPQVMAPGLMGATMLSSTGA